MKNIVSNIFDISLSKEHNINLLGNHIGSAMNVGHSSMILDNISHVSYISWWPQEGGDKPYTYRRDVEEEGRNPDALISINGLDEDSILRWWEIKVKSRKGERGGYIFKSNNCANIIADALVSGGADGIVKKPNHTIWTPSLVADWAVELATLSNVKGAVFRKEGLDTIMTSLERRMYSKIGEKLMKFMPDEQ